MSVFDGGTGGLSVILKQQDVAKAAVILQIQHAIAVGPKHFLDRFITDGGERGFVVRRFDDYFMGADAVHAVEEAFAFVVQAAFNAERRKLVGHYAQRPAGCVFSAAVAAIGEDFGGSFSFIAGAERTIRVALDLNAFADKIHGAFGAIGGNDNPAPGNWIFAKLRQIFLLGGTIPQSYQAGMSAMRYGLFHYAGQAQGLQAGIVRVEHQAWSSPKAALWRRTTGF